MKPVKLFDAKNRLSEVCEEVVRTGEPILITRRGKPLVRIVPALGNGEEGKSSVWDTVKEGRARFGPIEEELPLSERSVAGNRPSPLD